jgi:hypothetical protein
MDIILLYIKFWIHLQIKSKKSMIPPVYPKQDPEYRKRVMEQFYKSVRDTKWPTEEEKTCKPRGRKAKIVERPKAQPRLGERYNWLD